MIDVFQECRERVRVQDAARHYGHTPNRSGFIRCPFHREKTASLKLYPTRFKCFGCGAGGSVIDFVGLLFGLDAAGAVRRLNEDFRLGLPLDRPPTQAERQAAQQRQELAELHQQFEAWRSGMIRKLNAAYRAAHLALKERRELTEREAFAVQQMAALEYISDILANGSPAEQMDIFRDRREVEMCVGKILSNTPMRSAAS